MRLRFLEGLAILAFEPPPRLGPRPRSSQTLPHVQLDQWPPRRMAKELLDRCLNLPDVRPRQSRMAAPDCHALNLPDKFSGGPPAAFIVDHEFCHLHSLPDASIHLTLPNGVREVAISRGWTEQHLAARAGILPETLVMLYAPRDFDELQIVTQLIWQSYRFARGEGTNR